MNAPTKTPDPVTPTPSPVPKEEPEFHSLADIFPLLDENGEEFGALVDDIKDNGLRHPIIIYNNKILDGGQIPRLQSRLSQTRLSGIVCE